MTVLRALIGNRTRRVRSRSRDDGLRRTGEVTGLCVRGGYVIAEDFAAVADIHVDGAGRIAGVGECAHESGETLDASGAVVMPGCFDAHTHIRSPGYPEREDVESGTLAALVGGVTSFVEMPMADRGTCTAERVRERSDLFSRGSYADFAFFGAGGQGALPEIPAMAAEGVLGFKSFLRPPYPGREVSFEGATVEREEGLDQVARAIARTGLPWLVHAENVHLKAAASPPPAGQPQAPDRAGAPGGGVGAAAQPPVADRVSAETLAEVDGVRTAIAYARATGARLHVVHVTAADSLREIAQSQVDVNVTCEVCLPHLALIAGDDERYGPLALVSPAAKRAADRDALWHGVELGSVCSIASDHASFAPHEYEDLLEGRTHGALGIPSLEHLVPLTLSLALDRGVSARSVVAALTARPARRFGMWPRKGSLSVGADADLVVLDTTTPTRIHREALVSKGGYTPFDGWPLRYRVQGVLTRGRVGVWDGEVNADPGWGERLRPLPRTGTGA